MEFYFSVPPFPYIAMTALAPSLSPVRTIIINIMMLGVEQLDRTYILVSTINADRDNDSELVYHIIVLQRTKH